MSIYKGNTLISGAMPNSANQSLDNLNNAGQAIIDSKVSKSGDTMTGDLALKFSNLDLSTTISSNTYQGVEIQDTNGARVGRVEGFQKTNGDYGISIGTKVYGVSTYPKLDVWLDSSNVAHSSFPKTTCVDGQWIASNINVASNVNINGSSNLTYTVSGLPNDGQSYEILLTARGKGTTTNNQYIPIYIGTAFTGDNFVEIAGSRQMSTTANSFGGTTIIPIGSNRKLTLVRDGSYNGTVETLSIKAYRRIGTNS